MFAPVRGFSRTGSGPPGRPGKVVEEDSVTDPRRVTRPGHLEGHELAVVADDRVRRLVAGEPVEVRQTLPGLLAVERQLPEIDVPRAPAAQPFAVALDEGPTAVGEDPFGLVVLVGGVRVVR